VLGGGVCVNGSWLPPGFGAFVSQPAPAPAPISVQAPVVSSLGCNSPDPFAAIGGGTCVNGGWLPPGYGASAPAPSSSLSQTPQLPSFGPSTPPLGCLGNDPFVSIGGGTCVNGGWLPRSLFGSTPAPSVPAPSQPAAPQPSTTNIVSQTTGCLGADPFISLGGGACVNGAWLPPGMSGLPAAPGTSLPTTTTSTSTTGCVTPDPFVTIPGFRGQCINGNWIPVRRN
jgi:hypothetical protein